MVSLEPEQIDALQEEAFRRSRETRRTPDVSAVLREIVSRWMADPELEPDNED